MTTNKSNEKKDQPVRLTDLPSELSERGREIWLAGLGALARVEEEGEKIFRNLVERGEAFEGRGRKQIEAAVDRLSEQQKEASKALGDATKGFSEAAESVERAVSNTVTDTLGQMGVPRRGEVEELSSKVSQLSEKLDALQTMLDAQQKAAAKTTVYHIVPHEEGWAVKREGAERATSVHDTKKEALSAGRDAAKNRLPSRLIVHKQDRTVQETFAYEDEE